MLSKLAKVNEFNLSEFDLIAFLHKIIRKYLYHKKFEMIEFIHSEAGPIIIEADISLLQTAFENLIINALQAVSEEGKITIEILENAEIVEIKIINDIIEEDNFDVAMIGKLGFTTKEDGSGLGLYIVQSIINKHDGEFDVSIENNRFVANVKLMKKLC
jgi:signal transduction histidine kinase